MSQRNRLLVRIALLILPLSGCATRPQSAPRRELNLDQNWRFVREELPPEQTLAYANTYFIYPMEGFDHARRLIYIPTRRGIAHLRDDLAKRAAKMAVLVKNPERIRAVVGHITKHYAEKVEPNGFKAQITAVSRRAAVRYRKALVEAHQALVAQVEALDPRLLAQDAATLDRESNLRAQDRMRRIAGDPRLIIPGHDPAVMTKFAETAPGVVKIQ